MPARTFRTRHDLAAKLRAEIVPILNQQLADTTDLFTQVKTAHWNVKGREFIALHKLFDELAAELLEHGDDLAERVTALGGLATGTLRQAAAATRIPELPSSAVEGMAVVRALADRYAKLAASTRAAIDTTTKLGDLATADLFTEVARALDKRLWFLEAHVQGKQRPKTRAGERVASAGSLSSGTRGGPDPGILRRARAAPSRPVRPRRYRL